MVQRISPVPSISHDVIESLVLESTNVDNAPTASPVPTLAPESTTLLGRLFGTGSRNVTTRRAVSPTTVSTERESQSIVDRQLLLQLRLDTEAAELTLKKTLAEKALAIANRDLKQLTLETLELDRKISQAHSRNSQSDRNSPHSSVRGGSTSPPGGHLVASPQLRPHSPAGPGDLSVRFLLEQMQIIQQQAEDRRQQAEERADIRRLEADTQAEAHRRADRMAADTRVEQLEARLQALSHIRPTTPPPKVATGFRSNKCFEHVQPFSGEPGQRLRTWFQGFQKAASISGLNEHDTILELRLKLSGAASAAYTRGFADELNPTVVEVMAWLSNDFGTPYEEAHLFAAYVQCRRSHGSSGKDYLRMLATAQQEMQAAGIPLIRSPDEDHYYLCELGLSVQQRQTFLAQLSGGADVSDTYLRSLSPATEAGRRDSIMNPQDSDDRRACFSRRKNLIVAFLTHDQGDGKAARAAVTQATPVDSTPDPATVDSSPVPPTSVTPGKASATYSMPECRCMVNRADRIAEAFPKHSRHGFGQPRPAAPPPEYHGPNPQHASENQAEFTKRKTAGACFHCPMTGTCKVDYKLFHTMCPTHGRDASSSTRRNDLTRVKGAGSVF